MPNINFDKLTISHLHNCSKTNCSIITSIDNEKIQIIPKQVGDEFSLDIKAITFNIGSYILNINVTFHDIQDNLKFYLSCNSEEYILKNGENSFDIYISDNSKGKIKIFGKCQSVFINEFKVSENINEIIFTHNEDPSNNNYLTIYTEEGNNVERNIIKNNIYPNNMIVQNQSKDNPILEQKKILIMPTDKQKIHITPQRTLKTQMRHQINKAKHQRENDNSSISKEHNKIDKQHKPIEYLQENNLIVNKKEDNVNVLHEVKKLPNNITNDQSKQPNRKFNIRRKDIQKRDIPSVYQIQKYPIKKTGTINKQVNKNLEQIIDKIYILSNDKVYTDALCQYFKRINVESDIYDCNIDDNTLKNIKHDKTDTAGINKIYRYINIISDAKKHKYKNIILLDDYVIMNVFNIYPNYSNKQSFIENKKLILRDLIDEKYIWDFLIISHYDNLFKYVKEFQPVKEIQNISGCIIKSSVYDIIINTMMNYTKSFDDYIIELINLPKSSLNACILNNNTFTDSRLISQINYDSSKVNYVTYLYYIPESYDHNNIDNIFLSLKSLLRQAYLHYILFIVKPLKFDNKNFNDHINNLINKNVYIIQRTYEVNYKNTMDVLFNNLSYINTKYISITPCSYLYDTKFTFEVNNIIKNNNIDFINCGYINENNNIINGTIYSTNFFTHTDSIQCVIINKQLLNIYDRSNNFENEIYNFYKHIFSDDMIKKSFIFNPNLSYIQSSTLNIQYKSIEEKIIDDTKDTTEDATENESEDKIENKIGNKIENKNEDINFISSDTIANLRNYIDMSKDIIICYSSQKNSISNNRLLYLCENLSTYYNIIYLSKIKDFTIYKNIIYMHYDFIDNIEIFNIININKIFIFYNDYNNIDSIMKFKCDNIIFDIIKIPNTFNNFTKKNIKTNLQNNIPQQLKSSKEIKIVKFNKAVQSASFIIYSSKGNKKEIEDIVEQLNKSTKPQLLYIPNGFNGIQSDDIKPKEYQQIEKCILCYVGSIDKSLDFNIIKYIADNMDIKLVLINTRDKELPSFIHDKIIWLDKSKDISEINKYIKYCDICIFPYDITTYVSRKKNMVKNPFELYLAMSYLKPIISSIDFFEIENINKLDTGLYLSTTKNEWIINIKKIIGELDCRIKYNYSIDDYIWKKQSHNIYELLQTNEFNFLTTATDKLTKTCAYVTKLIDLDCNIIYDYYQLITLTIANLLSNNGIKVDFYQIKSIANNEINNKFLESLTTHSSSNRIDINYNDIKYLLNYVDAYEFEKITKKYDYVIYDSHYLKYIEYIHENSIYLNYGIKNEYMHNKSLLNKIVDNTILTITTNPIFTDIYRLLVNNNTRNIHYVLPYYLKDTTSNEKNELEINNKMLNILIPQTLLTQQEFILIKEIINQIRVTDVQFTILLTNSIELQIEKQLNTLMSLDTRVKLIKTKSFNDLHTYYNKSDVTLIINLSGETTNIEYLTAMFNYNIIISISMNGTNNIVINKFNGLLSSSSNSHELANLMISVLNDIKQIKLNTIQNNKLVIENFSFDIWEKELKALLNDIGWIYNNNYSCANDYSKTITWDEINNNFDLYWKNYAHSYDMQYLVDVTNTQPAIAANFKLNKEINLSVFNFDKKIAIIMQTNRSDGRTSIINELVKVMNVDVFVIDFDNKEPIKYDDFIYSTIITELEMKKQLTSYDIIIFFKLSEDILSILPTLQKPVIQYIYEIGDINENYISYEFPTKIISHSPFISNYLSYKYHVTPIIIPYPINNKFFASYDKPKSNKKIIGCITTFNKMDGVDIFIKALKRYKNETNHLEDIYDIKIYYYNYDNEYKEELKNKIKIFDICIDFVEIKKGIFKYLEDIDLLIIPSMINTVPILLLQAIANNKQIIVASHFGIREFNTIAQMKGYKNLFLMFRPNDVANLKNCIINWESIKDKELSDISSSENIKSEYIQKNYSLEQFCNTFSDIINKI